MSFQTPIVDTAGALRGPSGLDTPVIPSPGQFLTKAPAGKRSYVGISGATPANAVALTDLSAGTGAHLVGFTQSDGDAQTENLVDVIRRLAVFPQSYGAKFDGVSDDSAALQKAHDKAFAIGGFVAHVGNYAIKSPYVSRAPWRVFGASQIIISPTFVFPANTLAAITNQGFGIAYNDATADIIDIEDIVFNWQYTGAGSHEILALANVAGGKLRNVRGNAPAGTSRCDGILDIYACVKHLQIDKPKLANSSGTAGGGCIWIRNITSDGTNPLNVTEDIEVNGGHVATGTLDEALAVYGVRGLSRKVRINDVLLTGITGRPAHSSLASTFPANDGSAGGANAGVDDIIWNRCRFVDGNFANHGLRFGNSADGSQACTNIKAVDCQAVLTTPTSGNTYGFRNVAPGGSGNDAINCRVTALGATTLLYGFAGFDRATGSRTYGKVSTGIFACDQADNNPDVQATGIAIDGCHRVHDNSTTSPSVGIQCSSNDAYSVGRNKIKLTNTSGAAYGVLVNTIGGSFSPSGVIDHNEVTANNPSAYVVAGTSGMGVFDARGNVGTGTGQNTFASASLFRTITPDNNCFGSSPLQASKAIAPGNVGVGAPFATTVNVTGLVVNGKVRATYSGDLNGAVMQAQALSAGVATVRIINPGVAAGIAVGPGTLTVEVS